MSELCGKSFQLAPRDEPMRRLLSRRTVVGSGVAGALSLLLPSRLQRSVRAQAEDSWTDLIALLPDFTEFGVEYPNEVFTTADVALQFETLGLTPMATTEGAGFGAWIAATYELGFPLAIASNAFSPDFNRFLGWNIAQIDQTAESLALPHGLTLIRGRFDPVSIEAAWSEQGYQQITIEGREIAQLSAEPGFDFRSKFGQFGLGKFNNAVLLNDNTLAYTTSQPMMEVVLKTANGSVESILDRDQVAALIAAVPEPLVASMLISGSAIGVERVERGLRANAMPPITLALLGHTPGGPLQGSAAEEIELVATPPDAVVMIALAFESAADAETGLAMALSRIASDRAPSTDQPYTDYFTSWDGHVDDENSSVAVLELTPALDPGIWRQLLYERDLGFLF